ncbi:MAG: hypothetical protein K2X86_04825 [Cytophagaceae bacterium]|nr:hypothetical protein [Cytophagaceae bacterium]
MNIIQQEIIKKIKEEIELCNKVIENKNPDAVYKAGIALYKNIKPKIQQLNKSELRDHADTIAIVKELINKLLECGYIYFEADKNATVKLDVLSGHAHEVCDKRAIKEIEKELENAHYTWHWHGW